MLMIKLGIEEALTKDGARTVLTSKTGDIKEGGTIAFPKGEKKYTLVIDKCIEKSVVIKATEGLAPAEATIEKGKSQSFSVETPEGSWELKVTVLDVFPDNLPVKAPIKILFPDVYFKKIQGIIAELEKGFGCRVMTYFMPGSASILQNDADYFLEHLRAIGKQERIVLVVHSPGGDPMGSLRTAFLLRQYCKKLEIVVPAMCASAATQLALSADKLWFSPLGYLTPIDAQLTNIKDQRLNDLGYYRISFDSFRRSREMIEKDIQTLGAEYKGSGVYSEMFKYMHPLAVAEVDRLSTRSKNMAVRMMKMHPDGFLNEEQMETIAKHLVYDYPVHGYSILFDEARDIGLNVEMLGDEMIHTLWELLKYYRAVTREMVTTFSDTLHHYELNEIVIESIGKRVSKRYSYDRKLSSANGKWMTINDNTKWKKYLPSEDPKKEFEMMSVEAAEEVVKSDEKTA